MTCPIVWRMRAVPNASVIDQIAVDFDADLIALRRDLHRWPELAGDERRTAAAVAERLRAAGLSVSTGIGGHGVMAVLDGTALAPPLPTAPTWTRLPPTNSPAASSPH